MTKLAIVVGSVFGGATNLAEQIAEQAKQHDVEVTIFEDAALAPVQSSQADCWLIVTSTTGQGDLPPNIELFFSELQSVFPMLDQQKTAVIAMGDSSYVDSFCGAGEQIHNLLLELGSPQLVPMLTIDATEDFEPMNGAKLWLAEFFDALS
ncbi:flavodoxin domain-containing protein [Neiella marina]|uniref:Flavodoxin domain-containing protein n=1 Tax=Neiella holothuriorum TaxID=2870530 RepID=A0ABS7EHC2_9GAMM|nr:flavodoxin domain-containing protein [Neiella holothuriorum]MBW8191747.1 flavodoxin domain-containing protein [Neiella holothuriorum]